MSPCLTGSDLPVGPKVPLPPNDHPTQEGGLRLLEQLGLREKGHNADKAVMDHRSYEGAEKAESSEENWHRGGGGVVGVGGTCSHSRRSSSLKLPQLPTVSAPNKRIIPASFLIGLSVSVPQARNCWTRTVRHHLR